MEASAGIAVLSCQHLRDGNLTLQEASQRALKGHRQWITKVSLAPLAGSQFAPHSTAFEGLECIPIRVGSNSQYLARHDTGHSLLPYDHTA